MILHTEPSFRIYFGDAKNELYPQEYLTWRENLLNYPQFECLSNLQLNSLFFLHQVHGIEGKVITQNDDINSFSQDGDFLITKDLKVGIGVMTADCVPLVLYDKKNNAVAIVHAGWRGAVKGVALKAIEQMQNAYDTRIEDITIFLGPSAKKCCYQVDDQFGSNLEDYFFGANYLHTKPTGAFFDLPGFLVRQLIECADIAEKNIRLGYNSCTICNPTFWSHRRGTQEGYPERVGRQMTVVTLL